MPFRRVGVHDICVPGFLDNLPGPFAATVLPTTAGLAAVECQNAGIVSSALATTSPRRRNRCCSWSGIPGPPRGSERDAYCKENGVRVREISCEGTGDWGVRLDRHGGDA